MKREYKIVAMVVLATILIVSPVLAGGSSRTAEVVKRTPTRMFMTATITDVTNPGLIGVQIYMTNRAFIEYRGDSADVEITGNTLCLDWVNERASKPKPIDCSDLKADDKVNIKAKVIYLSDQTIIRAKRVVRDQRSIRH